MGISFESNIFGAAVGVLCAIIFRNFDAKPLEKHYEWKGETDDPDDFIEDDDNTIH